MYSKYIIVEIKQNATEIDHDPRFVAIENARVRFLVDQNGYATDK